MKKASISKPMKGLKDEQIVSAREKAVEEMVIVYLVRPIVKTTAVSGNVMVPYEFIDLITAKLRGEAYKLCNEDAVAAKWLNDYNALLESFKQWLAIRQAKLGM